DGKRKRRTAFSDLIFEESSRLVWRGNSGLGSEPSLPGVQRRGDKVATTILRSGRLSITNRKIHSTREAVRFRTSEVIQQQRRRGRPRSRGFYFDALARGIQLDDAEAAHLAGANRFRFRCARRRTALPAFLEHRTERREIRRR